MPRRFSASRITSQGVSFLFPGLFPVFPFADASRLVYLHLGGMFLSPTRSRHQRLVSSTNRFFAVSGFFSVLVSLEARIDEIRGTRRSRSHERDARVAIRVALGTRYMVEP